MYIKYFSHDITNFDSLSATVVGCSAKGCYIVAETPDGEKINGFCKISASIGCRLLVTPVNEFEDGGFFFTVESIQYPEVPSWEVIKGTACRNTNTIITATNDNVA